MQTLNDRPFPFLIIQSNQLYIGDIHLASSTPLGQLREHRFSVIFIDKLDLQIRLGSLTAKGQQPIYSFFC